MFFVLDATNAVTVLGDHNGLMRYWVATHVATALLQGITYKRYR